jgi:hypothetical protein
VRNLREGLGFTLFDGQPYLWYGPLWYYLCAALPEWVRMEWVAALLSACCSPLIYLVARRYSGDDSRIAGGVAALLMAVAGPAVAYTCHYGPEAAGLFLLLAALALWSASPRLPWAFVAGLLFGTALTLRLNLLFDGLLFLPWLRRPRGAVALATGTALPLAAAWWRNHRILDQFPWVFTWDGLATRASEFGPLSTLVLQTNPSIREALRRLHEKTIPLPEWIVRPEGGPAFGLLLFVTVGLLGVLLSRRWPLVLASATALFYFTVMDRTLSANYFRIHLPLFPVYFLGLALALQTAWDRPRRRALLAAAVVAMLAAGASRLAPPPPIPLDAVTPPDRLLTEPRYLVNSASYQPESLIYAFPRRSFIGMPLSPEDLGPFLESFPEYRTILWHEFTVQPELRDAIVGDADRFSLVARGFNRHGVLYEIYRIRSTTP